MKVLVLLSGGLDSSTALALAVNKYGAESVTALAVFYGQKHSREIKSAKKVSDYYGVSLLQLDLKKIFEHSDCPLLRKSKKDIPKESYADQIKETLGKKPVDTYVPFRNGLFLSCAAGIALSIGCELIIYGVHANDSENFAYPDCSDAFNEAMNKAIWEGSGHQVKIEAPFVNKTKADVVRLGLELKVPYELTWSCYAGGDVPCQKCGTCRDRASAFSANNITDPLLRKTGES